MEDINDLIEEILFLQDGQIINYESRAWKSLKIKTTNDLKGRELIGDKILSNQEKDLVVKEKDLNESLKTLLDHNIEVLTVQSLQDSLKNKYFELFS